MSANDATIRRAFVNELGQVDSETFDEDASLRRFLTGVHKELEQTALPALHSKIRCASISVGADDHDVIYGQLKNVAELVSSSKTFPRRLSARRIIALEHALALAVAVFEESGRNCRECGCWEWDACANGCWWVTEDLCSNCAPAQLRRGMGH